MSDFLYDKDAAGIVTVTLDMQGQSANTMNARFEPGMRAICDRLEGEDGLCGVVFASAKKSFFAGGDLRDMLRIEVVDPALLAFIEANKAVYRRLERLPVPVVAAINGAALGGGFELCLACNHRIVLEDARAVVGLPEVTLGLLPGAGGVVRMTALLGLEGALPYLLEGRQVKPQAALAAGLVDEIVDQRAALIPAAKAWIAANPDSHTQPWDRKGFRYPGGDALHPRVRQTAVMAPAMLFEKTRGLSPAPEKILDIAVNSMRMNFDAALRVESRGLCALITTAQCKAAISTFFFGMQAIKSGQQRPEGARWTVGRAAILGAGMMGAGIAYAHAKAGIASALKDTDLTRAEAGKAHALALCDKAVARGRMDAAERLALLGQITPVDGDGGLGGADLILEAVYEDFELKEHVIAQTFGQLSEAGIYGSNTSTLPISELARACPDPARFIGLHFFSPVEKMKVVEIILGAQTSEDTLSKAYDYVQQIGYMPIVVNDSRGFFTSRVFGTYLDEGLQLLVDGMSGVGIERAAWAAGMPVGPLAVFDEVSLILGQKVRQTHEALDRRLGVESGYGAQNTATRAVIEPMIAQGRGGRQYGGGFYDYGADASKTLWSGLGQFAQKDRKVTHGQAIERLLYRQAIETLRCLDEGVLRSEVEANLGGIFAIGFPAHTGGAIQFMRGLGIEVFAARAAELAAQYGERFAVPDEMYERLRRTSAVAA